MRKWLFILLVVLCPGRALLAQDTTAGETGSSEFDDSLEFTKITNTSERLSLTHRAVPDSTVRRLLRKDDYWYVPVGPRRRPLPPPEKPRKETWFEKALAAFFNFFIQPNFWGIALICGIAMGLIVWVLQSVQWGSYFRKPPGKDEAAGEVTFPEDPDAALEAAVQRGEYTQAVRLLFLRSLMTLGEQGKVKMGKDRTNREYLRELAGSPWSRDFARLVLQYEYTFYGGFVLNAPDFERVRTQFDQFQTALTAA